MSDRFLIFGHRGSPTRFPENTLQSFDEALRAGADGFETDLRLLSDKTAVLFHDDELDEKEIESLSLDHPGLRARPIQRVRDLAPYARLTTMVLEVKRSRWEDVLLAEIRDWPNVIVTSFDHRLIDALSKRGTAITLGLTTFGAIVGVPDYAARLGASWYFPNFRFVEPNEVAALHAAGVNVVPWTANRPAEWERLRAAGCDGVITDFPEEAVQWRSASAR
jgi:glycerophosphoryl diester phosphodiesterase